MISVRQRKRATISPPQQWQSHAPGSLMLFGEHAVLSHFPAIACAIDHWLHISWEIVPETHTRHNQIHITSSLAKHTTTWDELTPHPKLTFMMAGLAWLKNQLAPYPNIHLPALKITVTSDINSTQGLGSSSAVMAAFLVGITPLLPSPLSMKETFIIGRNLIQQVQGSGSGTDVAAALSGGVMQLTPTTARIQRLADTLPLMSVYVGYKTPTPEVIQRVNADWIAYPELYQHQMMSISQITHFAQRAILDHDLTKLGRLMNIAHGLMQGLGVSDSNLDHLVHQLRAEPTILGAKISGSGLGDCVIALGKTNKEFDHEIAVSISPQGAYLTENTSK